MPTNTFKVLFITLLFAGLSCIEPFRPNYDAYEQSLVVEGIITPGAGPFKVSLSETSPTYYPRLRPLSGASIAIEDNLGNMAPLREYAEGEYFTKEGEIYGVEGREYRLRIILENGETYESDYSKLPTNIELDTVYAQAETIIHPTEGTEQAGYRFYAEVKPYYGLNTYIAWRATETYEYTAAFTIDYTYAGSLEYFSDPYMFYRCWKTESIHQTLLLENPAENTQSSISVPLNHVHLSKFKIKYSLLLKQYVIDKNTHDYFKKINELNESQGSFYDIQPFQVYGNIYNINEPDEFVAGFFFAAYKHEHRIFMSDDSYESNECVPDYDSAELLHEFPISAWPIYVTIHNGRHAVGLRSCFDCRTQGGVLYPPDFW